MGVPVARVLMLVLVIGCAARARADTPPPPVPADISQAELDARLAALDVYLEDVRRPARAHRGTWIAVLSSLAAAQLTFAILVDDEAQRAQAATGFSLSVVGVGVLVFVPSPGRYASDHFRQMPAGTRAEQIAKLERGEYLLYREARVTRRTTAWWVHLIGVGVGTGMMLFLGLKYDDNWLNAVGAGVGTVATVELRIWTRSRRAVRDARRYFRDPAAEPRISLAPGGLRVVF